MTDTPADWHLKLFDKSVLKQAKWREIDALLPDLSTIRGLDLGADNGVISHLLRRKGGEWCSADMDARAVGAIRSLVGGRVTQIDGRTLPFGQALFDIVVIVDMLEHVEDDAALVRELGRVLRPGGRLIVNVPHLKRFASLRPLRLALGLTDAWHGHARPGYTLERLRRLLGGPFEIIAHRTYNRFFSELLDISLNYAYSRGLEGGGSEGLKGTVVTGKEMGRHERAFRWYSRLYPLTRLMVMLDGIVRPTRGYCLVVSAVRKGRAGER